MLERRKSIGDRIKEIEGKIVAVCLFCPHRRFVGGIWQCTVKRSHCHSARVKRWLEEIERLEME